jgi:hypothetical protein
MQLKNYEKKYQYFKNKKPTKVGDENFKALLMFDNLIIYLM